MQNSAEHETLLQPALDRLRRCADAAEAGWWPEKWRSGADTYTMVASSMHFAAAAAFQDLRLQPDSEFVASTRLILPDEISTVAVDGEPLLVTVNCIYPLDLSVDGVSVFADPIPVVASGPASLELLPLARPGDNGELTLRVRTPANQIRSDWLFLHFTTPSLWERFAVLDIAWAQLLLASRLAETAAEQAAVAAAARLVPEKAGTLETAVLRRDLDAMAEALQPVAHRVNQLRVHAIGHAHIDLAWCWTWDDAREVIKRDIRSVLTLMRDFPEMRFTHSQPASYEVLRTEDPEAFAAVCGYIRDGRWEAATLQWVESDASMPGGEAHARQLLEGVYYTREQLGCSPTVHLAPDTFGHPGNLPQLTTSAGARVYYHHRGNPGQAAGGRMWPAYWWRGDDGTKVLAISSPVYLGPLTPGRVARDVLELTGDSGLPSCIFFYGVGDHGGGPTRQNLQMLRRMQQTPCLPAISASTVGNFADDILARGIPLPEHSGETATIFEGCYTTHADVKLYNRQAENALLTAETVATLAGQDAGTELTAAWRDTLFHQFHDILAGTAIHQAYEQTAADFARTKALTGRVTERALQQLHAGLPAGMIAVTNPLGHGRTDVVHVPEATGTGAVTLRAPGGETTIGQYSADGLRFVATVPGFGTVSYSPAKATRPDCFAALSDVDSISYPGAHYLSVDTPHFFALVRKDCGVITTLYDKRSQREQVGYNIARAANCEQVRPDLALGALQFVDEHPHAMSSWVIDEVHSERSLIRGAALEVVESGPVRLVMQVRHRVRSSAVTHRIVFYAGLPRIDIEVDVDWQEVGSAEAGVPNLMLAFTTRQRSTEATYETPFSAASRPADGLTVPALRWADIGSSTGGLAVLNTGKYGFDTLGNRLRVNLIRSAYDPDATSDAGRRDHSRFAVVPHEGHWSAAGLAHQAAGFNQPLLGRLIVGDTDPTGGPPSWRPDISGDPGIAASAFKYARRGDGARVLRLHETTGQAGSVSVSGLPHDAVVSEASIVEDPLRQLENNRGAVTLRFDPFQVRTVLIS